MGTLERLLDELGRWPRVEGITVADVLEFSEPLSTMLRKMIVEGAMSLRTMAADLALTPVETRQIGQLLVEKGFASLEEGEEGDEQAYRINLAHVRGRHLPSAVWQALDHGTDDDV